MLKISFDDIYILDLPENHRFPMLKYELIPQQLIYEGIVAKNNFFSPKSVKDYWLSKAHNLNYIEKLNNLNLSKSEIRKTGFPLSKQLVKREYVITQGTLDCVDYAMDYGIAANIAGGTHHSFRDRGEGFCLFNDVATASFYAIERYKINSILIIDLDVHQGNGTASIFKNIKEVFTFSMHGERNYPFQKEKSDLDMPLKDGIKGDEYLKLLNKSLEEIKNKLSPQLIFFISGVDILDTDKLGRLKVSREDCKKRDDMVFEFAQNCKAPIVTVMGGGYSEKIYDIVEAHCNTFRSMIQLI
ncbi:MAG: histone deacetylase [Crocinitomicaceae bacterium TMED135]|nr:MAG: histone deacetylase [Bacteroidetes bacterium MED-G20]RPG79984.1 MAG: histone deacetylase [Crocinitomicaceae bacterium TMED135]